MFRCILYNCPFWNSLPI